MDNIGKEYCASDNDGSNKKKYSPFLTGGFEVKSTCGNVGSNGSTIFRECRNSTRFDWKAHHRQTNHLIGIHWDFIDKVPTIISIFYSNKLVIEDWGSIVLPKENGSRTTSVSVMRSSGIKKMMDCPILRLSHRRGTEK